MTVVERFNGTALAAAVDQEAILKSLNLNPRDVKTQALLLVCDRYGLDPLLKHMVLIQGNPYVTRDGYLAIAHRSGVFDGMEVLEQTSDGSHYIAKVAVYRKDMRHAFTFVGRFPKSKQMAKDYGPEMAVKVAEVQALRRAFNVTGVPAADERWDVDAADVQVASPERVHAELVPADPETGEVTGGGEPVAQPVAPPASVRRPPQGRSTAKREEEPFAGVQSDSATSGSREVDQAGGVIDSPPAEPTLSAAQMRKMQALFGGLGIKDEQAKRDRCGMVLGRTVEHVHLISVADGIKVIDSLESQRVSA